MTMSATDAPCHHSRHRRSIAVFLETTSVKGVPKAVRSSTRCLRALWVVALLFGVYVASYFTTQLFQHYLQYDANLQISEQPLQPSDFPDVTLCNLNPLANTPSGSAVVDSAVNILFHLYNPMLQSYSNDQQYNTPEDPWFQHNFRPGKFLEFMGTDLPENGYPTSWNFLVHCEWVSDQPDYNCKDNAALQLHTTDFGYCITFHPPPSSTVTTGFSAILFLDASSFVTQMPMLPTGLGNMFTEGARIVLHRQHTQPILTEGLNIEAGDHATVSMRLERSQRLGPPYSECQSDAKVDMCWPDQAMAKIGYGKRQCEDYCFQKDLRDKCDCVTGTKLSTPTMRHNVSFCGQVEDPLDVFTNLKYLEDVIDCFNSILPTTCPMPCLQDRYDMTLYRSDWPHPAYQLAFYDEHIKDKPYAQDFAVYENISAMGNTKAAFYRLTELDLIHRNFLQVNVIWKVDSLTFLQEHADMGLEGLIGTLGGVLNLWVGISFTTVIEVLEMIINCCVSGSSYKKPAKRKVCPRENEEANMSTKSEDKQETSSRRLSIISDEKRLLYDLVWDTDLHGISEDWDKFVSGISCFMYQIYLKKIYEVFTFIIMSPAWEKIACSRYIVNVMNNWTWSR